MAGLITSLQFRNAQGSGSYDFTKRRASIKKWDPNVASRTSGVARPKLQTHGEHGVWPVYGALIIDHEGLLVAEDTPPTQAGVMAERDELLAAILGDLTVPPVNEVLGQLSVLYAGWPSPAVGDVILDSYSLPVTSSDVTTLSYMFSWRSITPYFLRSTTPVYL